MQCCDAVIALELVCVDFGQPTREKLTAPLQGLAMHRRTLFQCTNHALIMLVRAVFSVT